MATVQWGSSNTNPISITSAPGLQIAPVIADNGGTEFGVAWVEDGTITVKFFDEQGLPSAALPTTIVTDGVYGSSSTAATVADVHMSAGGVGGYGVVWEESAAGQPSLIQFRYIAETGVFGPEISVSATAVGVNQHDAAVAGYSKDDPTGRPNVEGFAVVWVESAIGADQTTGQIIFQNIGVALDRRKDPIANPAAAGLDGRPPADPTGGGSNTQTPIGIGRDPSVAVADDGSTAITWIDVSNNIHLRTYDDTGVQVTDIVVGGAVTAPAGQQHVLALVGGEIVIAWVADADLGAGLNQVVRYEVLAPGAAVGTFTPGPIQTVTTDFPDNVAGLDFGMAALPDGGGFALTWNALDAGHTAIFTSSFTAGGVAIDAKVFHGAVDASGVATAGLVGDRIVAVYEDNGTSGDPGNISAQIYDTRTQANGADILPDGPGVTLIGDPAAGGGGGGGGGGGAANGASDVLVGTIGNDLIDGRLNADTLDGALGNDRIFASGGDDIIDGGGNGDIDAPAGTLSDGSPLTHGGDTVVFTGNFIDDGIANDDYLITYDGPDNGTGIFTVTDLRAGSPDGTDTIRNVEFFEFVQADGTHVTIRTTDLLDERPNVTPTGWGLTETGAGSLGTGTAPALEKVPDTDGFLVNDGPTSQPGHQFNPVIADSVGEFVGILWETDPTGNGDTLIRGQFLNVLAEPDTDTPLPNAVNVSDGVGIEFNPSIVSGGANGGWGIAFEERDSASDLTSTIRTNFMGPGTLTGVEQSVFDQGSSVNQHDAALSGSFLDRSAASPVGGSVGPKDVSDGYNVAWVSTHLDAAGNPTDVAGNSNYGHIMFQRFEVPFDAVGNPAAPVAGGIDGIANLGSDLAVWVGAETGGTGAIGRNPSTTALHSFETAVIWIESDGVGGERVAGRAYDDLGHVIPSPEFANISGVFPVAAGTSAVIVQAGAVNFGIAWITPDGSSPSGYTVMGTMFSSAGAGLNGQGFGLLSPAAPFVLQQLPAGFLPGQSDFHLTGISGEDSEDLVISWNNQGDVQASHIRVTLDAVTGVVQSMTPEGDPIIVNVNKEGVQDQNGLAGLLSDRFIAVYHDASNVTHDPDGDAGDIVARVFDTRSPGQLLEGDLVRNGAIQARADVIVGTNGNDVIHGDLQDNDGRTDQLYGGMGDDILRGGPDQSQGARVEILDGGEGIDTAVYTGKFTDYSIAVNGDGSFTIVDLRPVQSANGTFLPNDGTDHIFNIEQLQFLGEPGAPIIPIGFNPPLPPPDPNFDGTPKPWSLTDTSPFKEILVDTDPAAAAVSQPGTQNQVAVAGLQTEAAMAWVSDNQHIYAIRYEVQGDVDPLFSPIPVELTDAGVAETVADPFVTMAGGLGFLTAWEATTATDNSIHMAFGSTATNTVFDVAAGFPGGGLAKQAVGIAGDDVNAAEDTVVGSSEAGKIAVDPVAQGYEIVDVNNDTLEFGVHVAYVLKNNASDNTGEIRIARYDIPIYDLDPINGPVDGSLALDANGNFVPSADFGRGVETQPISIGADGVRGTADDAFASIVIPNGRDPSLGGLHDGQLVVSYVDAANHVHLKIYAPITEEATDRENRPGVNGEDIVVNGKTSFQELTSLPFATDLGMVAPGQSAIVAAQANGSFGVFWADAGVAPGTVDIKGIVYTFGGANNWVPSEMQTLETGLDANIALQVANTGVDAVGLEDGFLLSWELNGTIFEQRFDMAGNTVGTLAQIDNPGTEPHAGHSTAPLEDGRILVGYSSPDIDGGGGDVFAQYLDTRQPGIEIVGDRLGANRDVLVGTVGDDGMTGGDREDQLYGGLGNDLLSGGVDSDLLIGGTGNDILIGAVGQDVLIGGDGDDVLWGGQSGPADPKVDRDLQDALTTIGFNPALIASEPGADIVMGGELSADGLVVDDGLHDEISFEGEFGSFNIDLSQGFVLSSRTGGAFVLEDVIGTVIVDDVAGTATFVFSHDVEDAHGGLGNDILTGDDRNNVLTGGGGNDTFDGRGGIDTVVLGGSVADFTFAFDGTTFTIADHSHATSLSATNVELFQFADGVRTATDLNAIIAGGTGNLNPVIGGGDTAAFTIPENTTAVTTITATDPESSPITFSIAGGSDAAAFTIDPTTGALSFVTPADFEHPADAGHNNVYDVIVAASDGFLFATQAIAVTVVNVVEANNPPAITSNGGNPTAALSVAENTSAVTTVTATDPDGDNLSYSLTGGLDQSKFQIDAATGVLSFIAAPNFETPAAAGGGNVYDVMVSVSDGTASDTQQIAVTVTDVNEAPTITSNAAGPAATVAVAENTTAVTTVTATDPDAGASVAYGIAGGVDAALFTIDPGSGALSFLSAPDFEAPADANHDNVYEVVVRASDGSLTDTQAIAVTVTDVQDGDIAPLITSPNTASIAENGTAVLTVTAADPDGPSVGFSVVGGADAALFAINAVTGALSFLSAPDFEAPTDGDHNNVYDVIVRASDGTLFDEQEITVNVTNVAGLSLTGTAAANTLSGGGEEDTIIGLGGNDTLSGAGGNDLIDGGAGTDNLNGGAGNDTIIGGVGADIINGAGGNDVILYSIGDGGDTIVGDTGLDTLNIGGTAGDDTLSVTLAGGAVTGVGGGTLSTVEAVNADLGGGNDLLSYGAATTDNVTVDLGAGTASGFAAISGVENVTSGSGNDLLVGDTGSNSLNGGTGNDTLVGGLGLDTLTGGTGIDTVSYANETDAMVVNLTLNTTSRASAASVEDVLSGIENAIGGTGGDTITGSTAGNLLDGGSGNDSVDGGAGNDTIVGGDGHDALSGGAGVDSIDGGAGNDLIIGGAGNDLLSGGLGDDTFTYVFGDGADVFDGGAGSDTLNILGTTAANALAVAWDGTSIVSFTGGTLTGLEHLTANLDAGVDVLSYAGSTANVTVNLAAGTASGFDTISGIENVTGGSGNDTLSGDDGANVLAGGAGDDTYFVGAGDTITEGAGAGIDTVNSTASITLGANVENLQLVEGSGDIGGTGNTLANVIIGNSGNNTIDGGAGNDSITGGAGDDVLTGGTGNDLFVFAAGFGNDVINGFDANSTGGQDLLDVTAYHLNAADFGANVSIQLSGADTIVHIGVDAITLTGINGVGANAVTIDDFKLI